MSLSGLLDIRSFLTESALTTNRKCSWILEEMGAATHSTRKTWELLHEPLLQHIFLLDLFLQNFCKT